MKSIILNCILFCLFFGHTAAQGGELILSRKDNPNIIVKIRAGERVKIFTKDRTTAGLLKIIDDTHISVDGYPFVALETVSCIKYKHKKEKQIGGVLAGVGALAFITGSVPLGNSDNSTEILGGLFFYAAGIVSTSIGLIILCTTKPHTDKKWNFSIVP